MLSLGMQAISFEIAFKVYGLGALTINNFFGY